ncbi:PREDICTED: uncharacterized protein LOC109186295 [Ipomoea nil]|uniref:uncharacterized protein LOC109186295 n=1 Tax=Ipomoea nil TaxID=35883 RepID=UPI0009012176|nr:PREDICTED: uncharacterized protein LOC109186295 [Ipomoea nil]
MSSWSKAPGTDQNIAVRLKIHSKGDERRIKKWLLGIQGVRRVDFDVNNGVVIVSGTIDPPTLLMMLENYGVKAEIFGAQRRPVSPVKDTEIVAPPQSKVINPLNDPDIAALLERLPRISAGLQTVEVIKTVKIVFMGEESGGGGNKTLEITAKNLAGGGVYGQPHGGGICAASSCGGGGGHLVGVGNNMHCFPHGCPHGVFPGMRWPQPEYYYGGFSPLGPPPWLPVGIPSAPPLPEEDNYPPPPLPPPPAANPIYTAFSDDNTSSSCTIM